LEVPATSAGNPRVAVKVVPEITGSAAPRSGLIPMRFPPVVGSEAGTAVALAESWKAVK